MALGALEPYDRRARRRQLTAVTLLVCELCLLTLNARPSAAGQPPAFGQDVNPLDRSLPAGALSILGASPNRFNPPLALRFTLRGAQFDGNVADVILTVNSVRVAGRHIKITPRQLVTDVQLAEGANVISLRAYDKVGRTLHYNETIWCGNWTLRVDLAGADGAPVHAVSSIAVVLPGDDTVRQEQMTNRGSAKFKNLPAHKIVINARAVDGAAGTGEVFGSAGIVQIQLHKSSVKLPASQRTVATHEN